MQPTATSARRILQVVAVKPPDASVSTPPTATLCTATSERKDSSKPSLLTTVWLDADASTYEALCTAGATAISVATPSNSVEESAKEHASSAANSALQLIPQECLTRKRPRVHHGDATTSTSISGCGGARSTSSLTLPTGDTDARLDVLEEVELCSIVPRLSRTFGVEQLVQQLVPCTAFFESGVQPAKDGVGEEEERVRGSSASGSSSCLARLRAAADRQMWLLHTAGGGRASWCRPSPTAAGVAASAGTAGTAVCDGEEDRKTRLQQTSHCVNTWLPPVPSCMRGTSLDATSAPPEARADVEGEEDAPRGAGGEGGNSGASASASAPPPRVSAPPRPVRRLHLGSLGTPGVLSSTQQQNSAGEGDRYDRASGSELCLSFAAAQARYEAQREIQTASPLFAPRSCPTTRDNTATTATATSIMLPPSPADTQRGSGGEDEATAHATADASSNASTDKEPERRQDTAVAAAAARLLASTATYFHPHPPSDSFHTFASFALPDVAFKTDTLRHKASPHQRGEDAGALLSGPESAVAAPAAEFDGPSPPSFSSSSPSSSSALLSITHPAGAVVEWVSGGVSYTADTAGLMQEQQARAQRNICLPPPAPSTATPRASFCQRKGDGAEDRTSLRGAVLAQLQRLRRHSENIRTACHKNGARDAAAFATRSASISVSNDHIATAQDALCSASALPCPCVRCSPLQLQFAQVPAMASATLRHYVELLHQSALPSLEHPFPPPRHLRTPNTSLVATKEARGPHGAVDPLDAVFISLRRWCELDAETEAQRGAQRGKWTTAGAAKTEAVKEEEEKRGEEPPVQPRRQHVVRMGRPRKEQPAKLDTTTPTTITTTAAQAGSMSAPLGGIDDAVLDETVMVGVVPRGRPHQLRLVAPSRAFVLTLMQRLEEVVEVAVHILDHLSCPFRLARRETQEAWRAWLVEKYTASVWHTLETALTVREWNMAAQLATQLPFFSPPPTTSQPSHLSFELPIAFASICTAEEKARGVSAARSVCAAAREHTRACLSAAEDITARVILTALTPLLHRRITVMYELLRHSATPSLYASHRAQCEAYQQWYAATPSPQAVLRLLQRSERLRHALARCYPQYALLPTSTVQAQAQQPQQPQVGGGGAGFSFFPAWPLTASTTAGGRRRGRKAGATSRDATSHTTPPLKRRPGRPRRDAAKNTAVKTEQTDGVDAVDATAAATATTVHPPLVPLSPSPTSSAASAPRHNGDAFSSSLSPASIPWSPAATYSTAHHPAPHSSPSSSPSSRPSSPNAESSFTAMEGTGGLRYVPEVALLDPRYLQRFAWWTHRAHHNNTSGSSVGSGATGHSSGGGAGGASTWSSHSPVMNIPGDYLRVVPLQEQDAAIRAVLRFMTHRGRTMDLWEMAQYMQAHGNKSYVYV